MKKNTKRSTKGAKTTVNEKVISISPLELRKDLEFMKYRGCNCSLHTLKQYLLQDNPEISGTEENPSQNNT